MIDNVTFLLIATLFLIFVYYYCNNDKKSNLLAYSGCYDRGDAGLNGYAPNVWPNCYLP